MTLLRPPTPTSPQQAIPPLTPPSSRNRALIPFGRIVVRAIALVGLLVWAYFTTPQVFAFASQYANAPLASVSTWSGLLGSAPAPSASAQLSANAPYACSSGNASAVGQNLVVPQGTWICGDAMEVGGNLTVLGHVQGSAEAVGGNVTIAGEVDGDVTAVGGDILVQPRAVTHGHLNAIGGQVVVASGALVDQVAMNPGSALTSHHNVAARFHSNPSEAASFWLGILFWVCAALGLVTFAPEAVGHVRFTIARRFVVSGVAGGIIGLVGVVVGAVLFVTCLGIPITLMIALALWLAWVVGTVAFGSWLGASFLHGLWRRNDTSLLASTVLGVVLLSLLKSLPVAGTIVSLLVGCVALGASTLTLLSARRVSYAHLKW